MVAGALLVLAGVSSASAEGQTATSQQLKRDVLINADMWESQPRMMAAGLGFTRIIGVPGISTNDLAGSERRVRDAGGTWNTIECGSGQEPSLRSYTSEVSPLGVAQAWGFPTVHSDGLPVEFSWPIRPSTLDPTDFEITLNTGRKVIPEVAAISPNLEFNERSVAVLFGKFGNRIPSTEPGSELPVRIEVVAGETPLQLVGEEGPVSAVGLAATTSTSPYDETDVPEERTGPRLTAAKLTEMSDAGENAPPAFRGAAYPNDGISLYGDRAEFRLRVYTTGGFKPDGVRAVFPTDFERFFRLHVADQNGNRRLLRRRAGATESMATTSRSSGSPTSGPSRTPTTTATRKTAITRSTSCSRAAAKRCDGSPTSRFRRATDTRRSSTQGAPGTIPRRESATRLRARRTSSRSARR